jgi:hypothetical protein
MKLAEALVQRADAQRRLEQVKQRLLRIARVQEGDEPAEDPAQLISEFESLAGEFQTLVGRINKTNIDAELDGGSVTDALARRDVLRLRMDMYRELAAAATVVQSRSTKSEVRFRSSVSVADMQKQADALARQHRELDARIQEANWRVELVD